MVIFMLNMHIKRILNMHIKKCPHMRQNTLPHLKQNIFGKFMKYFHNFMKTVCVDTLKGITPHSFDSGND